MFLQLGKAFVNFFRYLRQRNTLCIYQVISAILHHDVIAPTLEYKLTVPTRDVMLSGDCVPTGTWLRSKEKAICVIVEFRLLYAIPVMDRRDAMDSELLVGDVMQPAGQFSRSS